MIVRPLSVSLFLSLRRAGRAMSDSSQSKTVSIAAAAGLAAAGLVIGLAGPKAVEKILQKIKPGGKFSGVSLPFVADRACTDRTAFFGDSLEESDVTLCFLPSRKVALPMQSSCKRTFQDSPRNKVKACMPKHLKFPSSPPGRDRAYTHLTKQRKTVSFANSSTH